MPRIRSFPLSLEIKKFDFEVARTVGEMLRLNRHLGRLRPDAGRTIEIDDLLFKEPEVGIVPVEQVIVRNPATEKMVAASEAGFLTVTDCRTSNGRPLNLAGNLWVENVPALQSSDGRHGAPVLLDFDPNCVTANYSRLTYVLIGSAIMGSPFLNSGNPTVEESQDRLRLAR